MTLMTRVNIGMTIRSDVVLLLMFALILSACATAPRQGSVAEPPLLNTVVIHSPQEQIGDFSRLRSRAILYVSVAYGEKKISGLLGETDYAKPHIPHLFRDRLIHAFTTTGPFAAVYAHDPSLPARTGSYLATVILNPYIDLIESSKAAGVGTLGLYALVGGSLTTQFNLNTVTVIESIGAAGNSLVLRDSYDVSGLATSTVYKETENVAQAWNRVIDATVPHLVNVIARAVLGQQPERGVKRSPPVVESTPTTKYQDTKFPPSTGQTGTSRRPAAKKQTPTPARTPKILDDLGDLD